MIFPKNVVLELTYKCNHKCLFCSCPWENKSSVYNQGEELSISQWKNAITTLLNCGVEIFSISGGEAIIKDGAKEIISFIRESLSSRHIYSEITLISNGLNLSMDWLEFFKRENIHLSISLPGLRTFSKHTGVDNVKGVLNWFSCAKSLGLKSTANITVTKLNLYELKETIASSLLHGAYDILLNRFLPGGRGLSHMQDLMITNKDLNQMLDDAEYILSLANRYGNIGTEIPLCSIDNPTKYKRLHIGYKCAAATGFFVVGPSGEIRTCNHSPRIVGHIFNSNIITDWEYWNKFADDEINIKECNGCMGNVVCSCGCREVAQILSSRVDNPDPSILLNHKDLYS
ncbi:MAG: radical SAM protein [Paramuribaculum sp.]|nr:radical SAM protein [Paramuribaculum sp.]